MHKFRIQKIMRLTLHNSVRAPKFSVKSSTAILYWLQYSSALNLNDIGSFMHTLNELNISSSRF
jgi:hypothetical protein